MTPLDPQSTALVLIDLQHGVVARDLKPYASTDVVSRCVRLARRFREIGALVVLVNVAYSADDNDRLKPQADAPPAGGPYPPEWSKLVPEIEASSNDVFVTKRHWGAFYGTELDLQLRRRGVRTIVIGGIATNFGVESTARDAWERNYQLVFAEDAMSSMSEEMHAFSIANIFPRLGIVRSTDEILAAT